MRKSASPAFPEGFDITYDKDEESDIPPVDRDRAINTASEALGVELEGFNLEIAISVRAYAQCEIQAIDFEHAKKIVMDAARQGNPVMFAMEHGGSFELGEGGIDSEGDEIGYLEVPPVDIEYTDPVEIDFREQGEPYAWVAAAIVKDLAALADLTDASDANDIEVLLTQFIKRARDALKKGEDSEPAQGDTDGAITTDRDPDRLGGDDQADPA